MFQALYRRFTTAIEVRSSLSRSRATPSPGDLRAGHLLEIAAATGIVTRVLARVLPETVSIIASDINRRARFCSSATRSCPDQLETRRRTGAAIRRRGI